jgi:hypothetical protein
MPGTAQFGNPANENIVQVDESLADVITNTGQTATNVDTVNTTLGTPAQSADVTTTLPANIQSMGAPPYVKNMQTAGVSQVAPTSSTSLVTFSGAGRIWYVSLSLAVSASSSYSGTNGEFAQIEINTSPDTVLLDCECCTNDAGATMSSNHDLALSGFPVASGDEVFINVNNGTTVSDVLIRASAVVYYSIP